MPASSGYSAPVSQRRGSRFALGLVVRAKPPVNSTRTARYWSGPPCTRADRPSGYARIVCNRGAALHRGTEAPAPAPPGDAWVQERDPSGGRRVRDGHAFGNRHMELELGGDGRQEVKERRRRPRTRASRERAAPRVGRAWAALRGHPLGGLGVPRDGVPRRGSRWPPTTHHQPVVATPAAWPRRRTRSASGSPGDGNVRLLAGARCGGTDDRRAGGAPHPQGRRGRGAGAAGVLRGARWGGDPEYTFRTSPSASSWTAATRSTSGVSVRAGGARRARQDAFAAVVERDVKRAFYAEAAPLNAGGGCAPGRCRAPRSARAPP